jgi:hypothetical protein
MLRLTNVIGRRCVVVVAELSLRVVWLRLIAYNDARERFKLCKENTKTYQLTQQKIKSRILVQRS